MTPEISNIYTFLIALVTLGVGAGGQKLLSTYLKYKSNSQDDKKDGWQIAIQTLKSELEKEREASKQYAIATNEKIIKLETKVEYLEKRGRLLESALIEKGMITAVQQIDYILNGRGEKIDEIHNKITRKSKKTK